MAWGSWGSWGSCSRVFPLLWGVATQAPWSSPAAFRTRFCLLLTPGDRGGCVNPKLPAFCLFFQDDPKNMLGRSVSSLMFLQFSGGAEAPACWPAESSLKTGLRACAAQPGPSRLLWASRTCSGSFPFSVIGISALDKHKSVP